MIKWLIAKIFIDPMAKQSEQSCQISNVQNNVMEFKNMNARFKTNIQQLEKEKKKYKAKKAS